MKIRSIGAAGFLLAGWMLTAMPGGHAAAQDAPTCRGQAATIVGAGKINGTSKADVIVGSDGDDTIYGHGGNDIICGGGGNDKIYGDAGDDDVSGGPGNDTIYGNAGDDTYFEGDDRFSYCEGEGEGGFASAALPGRGTVHAQGSVEEAYDTAGDDKFYGGTGYDCAEDYDGVNRLDGGEQTDLILGSGSAYGGPGDDYYIYAEETSDGAGDGYADGGSGNDEYVEIYGGTATGNSGNDYDVYGDKEGDVVMGGSGNDEYVEAYADDIKLNGGSGNDACYGRNYSGVTFRSCESKTP